MGTRDISTSFNDLVFENRFRQYGAYALRKTYSDRLARAAIIGIGAISLLFTIPFIMQKMDKNATPPSIPQCPPLLDTVVYDITPPEEKKIDPPTEDRKKTTPPLGDQLLKTEVTDKIDSTKENTLVQTDFTPGTKDGDSTSTGTIFVSTAGSGTTIIPPPPPPPPLKFVENWPKFDGDLGKWLVKHLVYPAYAKDAGIEGTVHVTFVVDEEGNISDVTVLRDIGGGCGEAAVRTVKAMPRWIPGTQGGKPVRVQYTQKIKFTLSR